jgi:hypothetical protein
MIRRSCAARHASASHDECLTLLGAGGGVSDMCRIGAGVGAAREAGVRSRGGTHPSHGVAGRLLPCHRKRRPRGDALHRRRGPPHVPDAAEARRSPLRPRPPLLLPARHALPRDRRRSRRGPLESRPVVPEPLRARAQRPLRAEGSPVSPALLLVGDPRRAALREHGGVHPRQPGQGGARRAPRRLALERRPTGKRTFVRQWTQG